MYDPFRNRGKRAASLAANHNGGHMVRFLARAARALCVTAFAVFCTVICLGAGVAQALTVISAMPEGEVRDLTQITVRFSETMRPLGVMDEKAKDAPLKLSVSNGKLPKGTFRWLDPSTLAYLFDAPLNRPLTIRALVPNGTAALSGETLDRDVAWTVTTPPLTLRADNPEDAPLPRTKATLVLHANYPLSLKQLREKSRLTVNGETRPFSIKKPDAAEYYQGRQSSWRYTYAIKGSLPKNGTVKLDIGPGLTARGGGDPAGKASFSFRGYGDLRLASWNMGGYGSTEKKGSPRPENRLTLTWNNPVGYGDLLAHITVTPEAAVPDGKKLPISGFMPSPSATGTGFTLPHVWEPRTAYTVTIRPGLKDRYGTTLAKEEVITFTTGDYQPYLLMPRGSVVMETELSRLFPLTMRNARTVTAAARYLPWGADAFRVLRGGSARGDELVPESGKAETAAIVVDTDDFPNKTLRRDLDIPSAFGRSPSEGMRGLVALRLVPPEKDGGDDALARLYANRNLEANVQITDLGVAARLGDDASLVWVAAFSSGKPVSGASVRLLDKDGNTIWSGETDSRGLALPPGLASFSAIPAFCMAETGNDASVLDLATSGLPADKAAYAERLDQASPWAVHAVTQLSLYRPGQTVNTALYARRYTDVSGKAGDYPAWLPVAGEKLQVSVQDRNGKVVHTFEAVTNAYGSAPFSLTLSPEAEPGWYTVRARSERFPYEAAATPFRVA
ncbi:MAG: hypothetical protein LIP28_07280, partial [Deltaproteobacteria bacterium]|nr:hypothetical protein [Deltaproteobacteria bacterium]